MVKLLKGIASVACVAAVFALVGMLEQDEITIGQCIAGLAVVVTVMAPVALAQE